MFRKATTRNSHDRNNLTEGPIFSSMLWFTLPFLFSNLLQTLYGTVDTLVIGHCGSSSGVSAVACGSQMLSMFTLLAIGLSAGGTVLVSQCIGAKDDRQAARIVGNLIIDFAVISALLTVLSSVFSPVFLSWLNVPAEAMAEATTYMRICSLGIPLIIGYNIVCALLRAMGDSKSPLIFVAVACGINIVGDVLLTGVLGLGVMAGTWTAWVIAVAFAYVVNKVFVFHTHCGSAAALVKEAAGFAAMRLASLGMETVIMYVTVEMLGLNDLVMKLLTNFLVIILNYVFSKLFIFKK